MAINGHTAAPENSPRIDLLVLSGLSLGLLLYHLLTGAFSAYGYFIDEFYYIACARHLAFGYVDHPPLSILLLAASRRVFGDSLPWLRVLPALCAAGTVFMTGLTVRLLGGSRAAIITAALAVIAMPTFLLMSNFYSMNAFEPLIWMTILYFLLRAVREENPRYWLAIGLLMGAGLEMKHTMALYGFAALVGLSLASTRRLLWNRWFLGGALCCLVLLLPNLIWQYVHGFPSLEFYRNALVNKNVPRGPVDVVLDQILFAGPFTLPLWIGGLAYFLLDHDGKKYRFLAWTYLILLGVMIAGRSSRPDRIAAMYAVLFAGGAVALGKIAHRPSLRILPALMIVLLACGAIVVAPVFTPVLSPPDLKRYLATIGFSPALEKGKMNEPIPQWLADRLGWHELAADVAAVYHSLPDGEQRNTVIVSTNYGEAGALELYGAEFRLPRVYATHNSYFLWGPPPDSVRTYIAVFVDRNDLANRFESVVEAAVHTCGECTRPQRSIPIYVARGPRFSITKEWANFRIYD
ncbi:MAG TPA: glycosyltransferase family 39 protein [Bacteroidota bacterium]|nr:glycosyltransferase family 39 protein [Bacteroidota bacterium]